MLKPRIDTKTVCGAWKHLEEITRQLPRLEAFAEEVKVIENNWKTLNGNETP